MTDAQVLQRKVAIIAGGSGGIGRETCRLLAEAGAQIVVGYRSNQGVLAIWHCRYRSKTRRVSRDFVMPFCPRWVGWTSWSTPQA